jgi:hypothetical protein
MEAPFQEVRQRLGFETQRHWSERVIRRTAPALLGLFSLVTTLLAHRQTTRSTATARRAAWYDKLYPTFSDALALVRKELRLQETFCGSPPQDDTVKVQWQLVERLTDAVCYAA